MWTSQPNLDRPLALATANVGLVKFALIQSPSFDASTVKLSIVLDRHLQRHIADKRALGYESSNSFIAATNQKLLMLSRSLCRRLRGVTFTSVSHLPASAGTRLRDAMPEHTSSSSTLFSPA